MNNPSYRNLTAPFSGNSGANQQNPQQNGQPQPQMQMQQQQFSGDVAMRAPSERLSNNPPRSLSGSGINVPHNNANGNVNNAHPQINVNVNPQYLTLNNNGNTLTTNPERTTLVGGQQIQNPTPRSTAHTGVQQSFYSHQNQNGNQMTQSLPSHSNQQANCNLQKWTDETQSLCKQQIFILDQMKSSLTKHFDLFDKLNSEVQNTLLDYKTQSKQELKSKLTRQLQQINYQMGGGQQSQNQPFELLEQQLEQLFKPFQVNDAQIQDRETKLLQNYSNMRGYSTLIQKNQVITPKQPQLKAQHQQIPKSNNQEQFLVYQSEVEQRQKQIGQMLRQPFQQSAESFHKIDTKESNLIVPDRIHGLIKSDTAPFVFTSPNCQVQNGSQLFKDSQVFYYEHSAEDFDGQMQNCESAIQIQCDECKKVPWRNRCKGKDGGCKAKLQSFLDLYRDTLVQSANRQLATLQQQQQQQNQIGGVQAGQIGSTRNDALFKPYVKLKEIKFDLIGDIYRVPGGGPEAFILKVQFPKIVLVAQLKDKWTVESFQLCSPCESNSITPTNPSSHNVYQYLTNQTQKIYQVYDSLSNFPLGLLLVLVWLHSLHLFETGCLCQRQFDLSGGQTYGLMPPMFRDMWMRPECLDIYRHNLCQTVSAVGIGRN